MTLRYQPSADNPFTFVDVKARTRGSSSSATLRSCLFDPATRVALFATLPLAATQGSQSMVRVAHSCRGHLGWKLHAHRPLLLS